MIEKTDTRKAVMDALESAGRGMSNICFNLSQETYIPANVRMSMKKAYGEWDLALRAYIGLERQETPPPSTHLRVDCPECHGAGEIFCHADDCHDDLCALNGDEHSCSGKVEPCGCTTSAEHVLPIELDGVSRALENKDGFWKSCSGCHELNEGVPTGPYSRVLKCHLGMGCSECGGIGAIWDTTDYEEMGRYLAGAPEVRIVFGLEAQGHIPAVEAALAEGADWREIGRRIGWDGETAKTYYERHLARLATTEGKDNG